MSTSNVQETEELIIKLLKKLERKGKNIHALLWRLMDEFEDEEFDEKMDENKVNVNDKNKITLLYDKTDKTVCKVGHYMHSNFKHLSTDPCIICGHTNNKQSESTPNNEQILKYLNDYNTKQVAFGPHQNQKAVFAKWVSIGDDKKWPLHYAAVTGNIANINQLCKNKNIEIDQKKTDWVGTTPITAAARYGQLESVIELMKHGANLLQPPDTGNQTPYKCAVLAKHASIVEFFKQYIQYLYNFAIDNNTNLECYMCYNFDSVFNKHLINGTMTKYVYCQNCAGENVKKVQKMQQNNKIIELRIIKTIQDNPSISVDTLCQMKDVKSLHTILKEILVSGKAHSYWLWLLDIDNFKAINTHLTHAVADTKIQALGEILKRFEPLTWKQWRDSGYNGVYNVWAFRQGGDEFALVVECNNQKKSILQKLYERLRNEINAIQFENVPEMKHMTVSIGVCHGQAVDNYEEMMKEADEAAESVKKGGKNGIAIYHPFNKSIYKNFNEI